MNVPPSEAKRLTLWEYEALLVNWNYLHDTDPQPEPMSIDEFKGLEQQFRDNPHLLQ